jgi:hypothetical protein
MQGPGAIDAQALINMLAESQGAGQGAYGAQGWPQHMVPGQGENPIAKFAQMVMQGAGGSGGEGTFQTAVGMPSADAMQLGQGQPQAIPQAPQQPAAPIGGDPDIQKQVALFEMFMKEVANDPYMTEDEKMTWANIKVQEFLGGQQ